MGSILLFPSRDEIARRRPRAAPATPASILLFTGVRYEHWVETELNASRPGAARAATRRRAPHSHRRA
jgi:hypothetical protein